MLSTFAPAFAEVKAAPSVTAWPLVEFHPERDVLDTEAASFAAWLAEEEDAEYLAWLDAHADEMAGLALAESRLESGLLAW